MENRKNKFIMVGWPEIQRYMDRPDFSTDCYFDPDKHVWFIPEWWEDEKELEDEFSGGDIGDLKDAMG